MSAAGAISSNWERSGNASSHDLRVVSDEWLVAAAKTGHSGAFDDLYKRHAEKMFRITYRITRNREDAEDAVQECFLNAFLHLKNFDGRSRFSTWLTRIAMNAALMKLRKNHASREVPMDESAETSALPSEHQLSDFSPNPEEHCTKSEREAILRDAIAKLRPKIRKAVEIHKLQECSLEETAEVLGTSVAAVKGRMFHARAVLRKTLQPQFAMYCRSHLKRLSWVVTIVAMGALNCAAQQPTAPPPATPPQAGQGADSSQSNDLQKQLEQLKKQYDTTTHDLEQRIAALEQQIQKQKEENEKAKQGTISAAELAAQQAGQNAILGESNQVGAKYQGQLPSEPTYDLLREADQKIEKLQEQVQAFEFHGYFRSGYALNSDGGQQVAFQAPGADAKYRLGNEAETYGEFIFVNNWLNPDHSNDKAWMRTEVMLEANTSNSATYASFPGNTGNDQFRLREAFVQGGHIFDSQPDAKFWIGTRYYRRQHIEINDFYPLDMSGYGGGFEDLHVGVSKLAVAFLAGARPDIVTQNGNYAKSNIDVRLYDMKAPFGRLGFWFDYAHAKGGTTRNGTIIPTADGVGFGLRFQRLEWHGGYNTFMIQYGKGAASDFSTSIEDPNPFLKSSERLLLVEHLLVQPNDRFAIMPIFIFQRKRDGQPGHPFNDWASFGARPEVFFTKYLSLAFEGGFDHTQGFVTTQAGTRQFDGWLRKFTIAPQIGAGRKFFSRPVLRMFVTYANWSNGFRGLVGGVPFEDRTSGLTYGLQAETWW